MIMVDGYEALISEVQNNQAIALFKLLEQLPFTQIVSVIDRGVNHYLFCDLIGFGLISD